MPIGAIVGGVLAIGKKTGLFKKMGGAIGGLFRRNKKTNNKQPTKYGVHYVRDLARYISVSEGEFNSNPELYVYEYEKKKARDIGDSPPPAPAGILNQFMDGMGYSPHQAQGLGGLPVGGNVGNNYNPNGANNSGNNSNKAATDSGALVKYGGLALMAAKFLKIF